MGGGWQFSAYSNWGGRKGMLSRFHVIKIGRLCLIKHPKLKSSKLWCFRWGWKGKQNADAGSGREMLLMLLSCSPMCSLKHLGGFCEIQESWTRWALGLIMWVYVSHREHEAFYRLPSLTKAQVWMWPPQQWLLGPWFNWIAADLADLSLLHHGLEELYVF